MTSFSRSSQSLTAVHPFAYALLSLSLYAAFHTEDTPNYCSVKFLYIL
jgi:hypothetical protein